MNVVIKQNDWLACRKGHKAYKAIRDIPTLTRFQPEDFVDSFGEHPKRDTPIECPECGRDLIFKERNGHVPLYSLVAYPIPDDN